VELDESVDRFGAAVAGSAGVEVGQERRSPLLEGVAEASDLGDRAGRERGEDLLGDPATLGRGLGVVGGAELLGALPGHVDLVVTLVGGDRSLQPGALSVGELLDAAAQDHPDPVQRVALAAAMAVDLLLDTTTDLIDRGAAELDDVEGIEHCDGVLQLVIDGVLVAMERIEGRDLDPVTKGRVAGLEPLLVGGARAAGHEVEQSGFHLALLVSGEVDHPGELLGATPALVLGPGRDVVPDVLVDPQCGDVLEPGLVCGHRLEQRLDRAPHGAPGRAELAGEAGHRGVLAAQLVDRPPARPPGQQCPWRGQVLVLLDERASRALRFGAAPDPLAPDQRDRAAEAGKVDQPNLAATVAVGHHAARPAPGDGGR